MTDVADERRSELRISARLSVQFEKIGDATTAFKAFSLNVSPGGVCIRSKRALPKETRVSLHLTIDGEPFHLLGAVAWVRGDVHGIRFVNPSRAQRARLEELVATKDVK